MTTYRNSLYQAFAKFSFQRLRSLSCLLLLFLVGQSNLAGQVLHPITIRQSLDGQVIAEVVPNDWCMRIHSCSTLIDTNKIVISKAYKVRESGDTVFNTTYSYNYAEYPRVSADVFTFHAGIAPYHFPKTITRESQTIDSKTIEIRDHYWTGTYGHEIAKPHILRLNYNRRGQLVRILETYDTEISNVTKWSYFYRKGLLQSFHVGDKRSIYRYDETGKILSTIFYSGQRKPASPYMCLDSLKSLYFKESDTYRIDQLLDGANVDIKQLVFYRYSNGKLSEMACYDEHYGIQYSVVNYDSLQRISGYRENHFSGGGLTIEYIYEPGSYRLMVRKERVLSECFTRGCPETEIIEHYSYGDHGMIREIIHQAWSHNNDGTKRPYYDKERKGKLYQYQEDNP